MVQCLMDVLPLLLIIAIVYCIVTQKSYEEFGDHKDVKQLTNDTLDGSVDGIYRGFEDRDVDQLEMIKYRHEKWIKPTLKRFLDDYHTSREVQERYRL